MRLRTLPIYLSTLILSLSFAPPVQAQDLATCWSNNSPNDVPTLKGFECIFQSLLGLVVQALGLGLFIMLLFGGFKYLTAGGDAKATESGKNTITLAFAGLAAGILGWFVLQFIQNFTGIDLSNFSITVFP